VNCIYINATRYNRFFFIKQLFPILLLPFFFAARKCFIFSSFFVVSVYFFNLLSVVNIGRYSYGRSRILLEFSLLFGALYRHFRAHTPWVLGRVLHQNFWFLFGYIVVTIFRVSLRQPQQNLRPKSFAPVVSAI
jgi:hypothetical protein